MYIAFAHHIYMYLRLYYADRCRHFYAILALILIEVILLYIESGFLTMIPQSKQGVIYCLISLAEWEYVSP